MSLVDHESKIKVNYSKEDVFNAARAALSNSSEFKISNANKITRTIELKAGMSLFSWGENIIVSIIEDSPGTTISILSVPKTGAMLGGVMDMGKNRSNITKIMNAISKELEKYQELTQQQTQQQTENKGIVFELKQLAELKECGLISDNEYEHKRCQILGFPETHNTIETIILFCPYCNQKYKVESQYKGCQVDCQTCHSSFIIPEQ